MSNRSSASIDATCATAEAAARGRTGSARPYAYLSFCFPPLGGPESRHNLSMVRALAEHGFIPTVVSAPADIEYPKDEHLSALIPGGIDIRRYTWPHRSNAYVARGRRLLGIPANPLGFAGSERIYRAARSLVEERPVEFIYSVHGIGAVHLAALRLKKRTGLPWIAELRDPLIHNRIIWAYMHDHSWKWWEHRELRRTRSLQEQILGAADLIVVESPVHAQLLIADFDLPKNKVVPYGLGYGEEYFVELAETPVNFTDHPVIGFVGSLYYSYDDFVQDFLAALQKLECDGHTFTFVPVGSSSGKFAAWAQKLGLASVVPIERVRLSQALALMRDMDLGLVCVSPDYPANINSKMWEYLRMNLSILALVPDPGAMADLVKEGQCGYVLPYDRPGMRRVLTQVLRDHRDGCLRKASTEFVARFSRRRLVAPLADRINRILSPSSRGNP